MKITRRSFTWKCQDCGMTERKEPHLRLSDHMVRTHDKKWNAVEQRYVSCTANAHALAEERSDNSQQRVVGGPNDA